ncbi:hypothetical protein WMY93_028295 [Mugilogobius chulae]|uniref:Uncharacterized protein n=1 Tax=Mugilogobius chulae TaxID=88201 RepID=A0AAW0MU63_9GOBI
MPSSKKHSIFPKRPRDLESGSAALDAIGKNTSIYLQRLKNSEDSFASSPDDIRYYTRFPSYEHLMEFWNLIRDATSRMVRVTTGQKNLSTSTSTVSPVTRPTESSLKPGSVNGLVWLAHGSSQEIPPPVLCSSKSLPQPPPTRDVASVYWSAGSTRFPRLLRDVMG